MGSLDASFIPSLNFNPLDPQEFRTQAHRVVDFIADYYLNVESLPVLSRVDPGQLRATLPQTPPFAPEPLEMILEDITNLILPGMTHWLSPNFFAFFPATASTAGFVGEMLCAGFNSVGFNWLASPAATELETVVMDWLAGLLDLPADFKFSGSGGGVIQNTTSESILVTLVAARERRLESSSANLHDKLTVYASEQTHSTFAKVCGIAGVPAANIRLIPTGFETGFALSPLRLRKFLDADVAKGMVPLYLCLTVGTTSTTAVDPISELADVAGSYRMWVHVDAAYGGSACICPEFRQYLEGVERVDSVSMSPHKWLLSYMDCCCLWLKSPGLLVKALSTNPEYLRNTPSELGAVVDFKDWQIGTGRRFKSLRLWLIMRSYGVANLQNHIRSDVRMAKTFETLVRSDPRFEVVVPRRFALVCFRLKPPGRLGGGFTEILNRKLLDWVNATGRVYMTHTVVGGVYVLRLAVGATLTEERHVRGAWELIKEGADALLRKCRG